MKMCARVLIAVLSIVAWTGVADAQHTYSKAVQKACAKDYKAHCGRYGVETEALRLCMDRAGQRLTTTCVRWSLLAERRKRMGR